MSDDHQNPPDTRDQKIAMLELKLFEYEGQAKKYAELLQDSQDGQQAALDELTRVTTENLGVRKQLSKSQRETANALRDAANNKTEFDRVSMELQALKDTVIKQPGEQTNGAESSGTGPAATDSEKSTKTH